VTNLTVYLLVILSSASGVFASTGKSRSGVVVSFIVELSVVVLSVFVVVASITSVVVAPLVSIELELLLSEGVILESGGNVNSSVVKGAFVDGASREKQKLQDCKLTMLNVM